MTRDIPPQAPAAASASAAGGVDDNIDHKTATTSDTFNGALRKRLLGQRKAELFDTVETVFHFEILSYMTCNDSVGVLV